MQLALPGPWESQFGSQPVIKRLERNARRWQLVLSRWIYEVPGSSVCPACFVTHVEAMSPPGWCGPDGADPRIASGILAACAAMPRISAGEAAMPSAPQSAGGCRRPGSPSRRRRSSCRRRVRKSHPARRRRRRCSPGAIPITALASCIGWPWGLARRALSPQTMQTQRCRRPSPSMSGIAKRCDLLVTMPQGISRVSSSSRCSAMPRTEAGADTQGVLIDGEEALLQGGVGGVGWRDAESGADHAACARRDMRTQLFQRQRVAPLFLQQSIEGARRGRARCRPACRRGRKAPPQALRCALHR
jgi:hypothetical protein